jgi:predicted enzyme related to lactoylglutathione lyase
MNASQFQRAMPVLEVTDMPGSLAFYRDKLGFSAAVWGEPPSFAIVQRGAVSIALDASQRGQSANNQWWAAYIYVADVNALYDEFRDLGIAIHREIDDAPYGCRDFDVADPDGYVLAFGQDLNPGSFPPGLGPDAGRDDLSKAAEGGA